MAAVCFVEVVLRLLVVAVVVAVALMVVVALAVVVVKVVVVVGCVLQRAASTLVVLACVRACARVLY